MSTATLTSLAMLKLKIDQGGDYLDYLHPFVLQVLVEHRPDPVTDVAVKQHLKSEFGLEIPNRTIQLVLKRLARKQPLIREKGVYRITGDLPDPGIAARRVEVHRHIKAVIAGLIEFSKKSFHPFSDDEEAVQAVCSFLEEFDVSCLKAYLRGTAIPSVSQKKRTDVVLVSQYVLHLQQTDPERFASFQILVQGHMLANALLCPDLVNAPKTFKDVIFYLDTPLLLRWLGLEGKIKQDAVEELAQLVKKLGGSFAVFAHTRDELKSVIHGAANHLNDPDARGAVVMEARRQGTTRSDLLLFAEQMEDKLMELQVEVRPTPPYIGDFQIDEEAFSGVLDDEVSYFNPMAKEHDIKSVRSIYVLRKGKSVQSLEKAVAVLVTTNTGFARAAYRYGERYEESRNVSPVITDFSLSNTAWLKAPMSAPNLPITEILAFSYAALELPKSMLENFLKEVEKLEKQGKITARDHQLLRASPLVQEELMRLTLGEEKALTEQTVIETLERVTSEIKREESEKYNAEQDAHGRTKQKLATEQKRIEQIRRRIHQSCLRKARIYSWGVAITIGLTLAFGIVVGSRLFPESKISSGLVTIVLVLATLVQLIDALLGIPLIRIRERVEKFLLAHMIQRESARFGIDIGEEE